MWDPFRRVGVLNDFDLVQIYGEPSGGGRQTGTITFMAFDLLSLKGSYKRLYRHDVESLIWVLIWTCLSLEYTDDDPPSRRGYHLLRQWDHLELWKNPLTSRSTRLAFLTNTDQFGATKYFRRLWNLATQLIKWLNDQMARRRNEGKPVDVVDNTEETYNQIMALVKDYEASV